MDIEEYFLNMNFSIKGVMYPKKYHWNRSLLSFVDSLLNFQGSRNYDYLFDLTSRQYEAIFVGWLPMVLLKSAAKADAKEVKKDSGAPRGKHTLDRNRFKTDEIGVKFIIDFADVLINSTHVYIPCVYSANMIISQTPNVPTSIPPICRSCLVIFLTAKLVIQIGAGID